MESQMNFSRQELLNITKYQNESFDRELNCTCMGRFDVSGTSKNDNLLKVLVGHGVKKYGIEIFFRGLQAEICLFVYILQHFKKSINKGIKTSKNNFWA